MAPIRYQPRTASKRVDSSGISSLCESATRAIASPSSSKFSNGKAKAAAAAKCMRCGLSMKESSAIFVTINQALSNPEFYESEKTFQVLGETVARPADRCRVPRPKQKSPSKEGGFKNVVRVSVASPSGEDGKRKEFRQSVGKKFSRTKFSSSQASRIGSDKSCESCGLPEVFHAGSSPSPGMNSKGYSSSNASSDDDDGDGESDVAPCADCHVCLVSSPAGKMSLMLQMPDREPPDQVTRGSQTARRTSSTADACIGVDILGMYPSLTPSVRRKSSEEKEISSFSGAFGSNLPEMDRAAEAAYRSHMQNLVPCDFCGRRFTADRVMVHQSACIKRPRRAIRSCITPDDKDGFF